MMPLSPRCALEEIGDLLAAAGFRPHRQPQVGPVEAMHEHRWLAPEQLVEDVGAGAPHPPWR